MTIREATRVASRNRVRPESPDRTALRMADVDVTDAGDRDGRTRSLLMPGAAERGGPDGPPGSRKEGGVAEGFPPQGWEAQDAQRLEPREGTVSVLPCRAAVGFRT